MEKITYHPIGIIHTPFKKPAGVPIQSAVVTGIQATITIYPQYREGLADLDGFSHIILLYHFHLSKKYSLKVTPYMDEQLRGIFATRAPARPNSIGLSVVRLLKIEEAVIFIENVDLVDGTPLLDIKPYVPDFDRYEIQRIGWLKDNISKLENIRGDGRFKKRK
jgi:tRNA-Thr(GGU) m(6)t(6)A37 methyltransferase TsaA